MCPPTNPLAFPDCTQNTEPGGPKNRVPGDLTPCVARWRSGMGTQAPATQSQGTLRVSRVELDMSRMFWLLQLSHVITWPCWDLWRS